MKNTKKVYYSFFAAVLLGLNGCAVVDDYLKKEEAPLVNRLTQLEANAAQEKTAREQVNTRVTQVVTDLAATRKVTDESALAVLAVNARVTSVLANRFNRQLVETVSLRFASGQFKLLAVHQEVLLRVAKTLADNPTFTADVVGFTDGLGTDASNLNLSWQREESVRRFLAERGKALNRLSFIGLGEDLTAGDKNNPMARAQDRQVSVVIFKPVE